MSLLDRLFRPPSREKYARMFVDALRGAGDTREARVDMDEFRVVFEDGSVSNLTNQYLEYCQAPRSMRKRMFQTQVRVALSVLRDIPEEFEDAMPDLRPRIWPRSMFEFMALEARLNNHERPDPPLVSIGEHLTATVVYDLPDSVRSLEGDRLEKWGTTLYEALEVAKTNLRDDEFAFASIGERLYQAMGGDSYDAARMLLYDVIGSFRVQGRHVAMAPTRDTLLVTGTEDEEGLRMMLELGERAFMQDPRPFSATPLVLDDDAWVDWMPPREHPLYDDFRTLELKSIYDEYAEQKKLLEAIHAARNEDIFVASFTAVERDDGSIFSYCVWSDGITHALLPKTQRVLFYRPEADVVASGPWDEVVRVAGDLMEETDEYPPRFRIRSFPDSKRLAEIGIDDSLGQ